MKSNMETVVNELSAGYKLVGHQRQWENEPISANSKQLKCAYPKAKILRIHHNEMIYHLALNKGNQYPLNEKALSVISYLVNSLQNAELKESLLEKLQGVNQ